MAHVRYATRGRKDRILDDAHPHTIGGRVENRDDHIIILDCEMAMVHNGQVDCKYFIGIDKKVNLFHKFTNVAYKTYNK